MHLRALRLLVLPFFLQTACSGDVPEATASGTGTGSESDATTSAGSGSAGTTSAGTTSASGSASNSNSGTGGACVPGMSVACVCPNGTDGAQVCAPDGLSYGACECGGATATSDPTATGTTGTTGTTGVDPTTTTDPSTGTTGTTGTTGVLCEDPGPEPNDDQQDAVDLGDQGCNAPAESLMGVLDGDADVDWFTYNGQWGMNCQNNSPNLVNSVTADESVRLCVFAECNNGDTIFDCGNAQDAEAPDGQVGCCDVGQVDFNLNCAGTNNESAQVWIRVDQAPPESCVAYTVDYDYNES